jgi:hypothetical protein
MIESSLENVPENLREYYRRRENGKWMLDVCDFGDAEDVRGLKSALAKARIENKELRAKLGEMPSDGARVLASLARGRR